MSITEPGNVDNGVDRMDYGLSEAGHEASDYLQREITTNEDLRTCRLKEFHITGSDGSC